MSNPMRSWHDDADLPVSAMGALFGGSILSVDHTGQKADVVGVGVLSRLVESLHSMTLIRGSLERKENDFEVTVKTLTGKDVLIPHMSPGTKVKELKEAIYFKEGIPADQIRLIVCGLQLEDDRTLEDSGVNNGTVIHMVLRLRGGWYPGKELLDPEFHYDFTHQKDEGKSFSRGNEIYKRPYGWKRYALKVRGKYDSDRWLGEPGSRLYSNDGEWPVSYHGTSQTGGKGIAEKGYDMSKGKRFLFGQGIYSTPDPQIAKKYALPFKHKGKDYKVMVQNRYDPSHTQVIQNMNYLVTKGEEFIRPYGILVREA